MWGITLASNRILHPKHFLNIYLEDTHPNTDSLTVQSSWRTWTVILQIKKQTVLKFLFKMQNPCPPAAFVSTFATKIFWRVFFSFKQVFTMHWGTQVIPMLALRSSQVTRRMSGKGKISTELSVGTWYETWTEKTWETNLGTSNQIKKKKIKKNIHAPFDSHTICNLFTTAFYSRMQQGKGVLGRWATRSGDMQFSLLQTNEEDRALLTCRRANCIINSWRRAQRSRKNHRVGWKGL